jgi:hypothetical protein
MWSPVNVWFLDMDQTRRSLLPWLQTSHTPPPRMEVMIFVTHTPDLLRQDCPMSIVWNKHEDFLLVEHRSIEKKKCFQSKKKMFSSPYYLPQSFAFFEHSQTPKMPHHLNPGNIELRLKCWLTV